MQEALALTWKTLAARVRNYRIGAFACLGLSALLVLMLLVSPSWWLIGALPLFLALGYTFVYRDQKLLFNWESAVLNYWSSPSFVMGIFSQALSGTHQKLANSIKAMVAILPPDPDYQAPTVSQINLAKGRCWTRKAIQDIRLIRSGTFHYILVVLLCGAVIYFCSSGLDRFVWLPPLFLGILMSSLLKRRVKFAWNTRMDFLDPNNAKVKEEFSRQIDSLDFKMYI